MRSCILVISLVLDVTLPSINRRYYQYCYVEGLAASLDVCSNVFAALTSFQRYTYKDYWSEQKTLKY